MLKVKLVEPPKFEPLIVISSPATCPEPPSMIVTVGVDEPSVTILNFAPVPEPVVDV